MPDSQLNISLALLRLNRDLEVQRPEGGTHPCLRYEDTVDLHPGEPGGSYTGFVMCLTCAWVGVKWERNWPVPEDLRLRIEGSPLSGPQAPASAVPSAPCASTGPRPRCPMTPDPPATPIQVSNFGFQRSQARAARQQALEARRHLVLTTIQRSPGISTRALSTATGLNHNVVTAHVARLVRRGQVRLERRTGRISHFPHAPGPVDGHGPSHRGPCPPPQPT